MRKYLLLTLMLYGALSTLTAQQGADQQRLKQLKVAYLSDLLELTTDEGQQFWPVYNDYDRQRQRIDEAQRNALLYLFDAEDEMSEKEIFNRLQTRRTLAEERHELDRKFAEHVLPILGLSRTGKLLGSEEDFKRRMVEELRQRRESRGGGGGQYRRDGKFR